MCLDHAEELCRGHWRDCCLRSDLVWFACCCLSWLFICLSCLCLLNALFSVCCLVVHLLHICTSVDWI